jgi:hypothetical protein
MDLIKTNKILEKYISVDLTPEIIKYIYGDISLNKAENELKSILFKQKLESIRKRKIINKKPFEFIFQIRDYLIELQNIYNELVKNIFGKNKNHAFYPHPIEIFVEIYTDTYCIHIFYSDITNQIYNLYKYLCIDYESKYFVVAVNRGDKLFNYKNMIMKHFVIAFYPTSYMKNIWNNINHKIEFFECISKHNKPRSLMMFEFASGLITYKSSCTPYTINTLYNSVDKTMKIID